MWCWENPQFFKLNFATLDIENNNIDVWDYSIPVYYKYNSHSYDRIMRFLLLRLWTLCTTANQN